MFESHITVQGVPVADFKTSCVALGCKPVVIGVLTSTRSLKRTKTFET